MPSTSEEGPERTVFSKPEASKRKAPFGCANRSQQKGLLFKEKPVPRLVLLRSGSRFITGSYDRTCRVWDTLAGKLRWMRSWGILEGAFGLMFVMVPSTANIQVVVNT